MSYQKGCPSFVSSWELPQPYLLPTNIQMWQVCFWHFLLLTNATHRSLITSWRPRCLWMHVWATPERMLQPRVHYCGVENTAWTLEWEKRRSDLDPCPHKRVNLGRVLQARWAWFSPSVKYEWEIIGPEAFWKMKGGQAGKIWKNCALHRNDSHPTSSSRRVPSCCLLSPYLSSALFSFLYFFPSHFPW